MYTLTVVTFFCVFCFCKCIVAMILQCCCVCDLWYFSFLKNSNGEGRRRKKYDSGIQTIINSCTGEVVKCSCAFVINVTCGCASLIRTAHVLCILIYNIHFLYNFFRFHFNFFPVVVRKEKRKHFYTHIDTFAIDSWMTTLYFRFWFLTASKSQTK